MNGFPASTNKNLICILKRTITKHQRNWHNELNNALWEDRVTPKQSLRTSPFFLTYGFEAILPPNIFLPSLQLAQSIQDIPLDNMQRRIDILLKLEEERDKCKRKFELYEQQIKIWFDTKKYVGEEFQIGDLVLK